MSKQPTIDQVQAHYAADVKAASDTQLFAIVRGDIKGSKVVREGLQGLARLELKARGHDFPDFSCHFAARPKGWNAEH